MSGQTKPDAFNAFDPLTLPLDGTRIVEASAGTGKTYSITLLYLRSLLELRLDPKSILVVTFTRAATSELRHRIRSGIERARGYLETRGAGARDETFARLLDPYVNRGREDAMRRLSVALDSLDRASIFTIDGFCQRVLTQYAFEGGVAFESDLVTDARPIVDGIAADLFASRFAPATADDFRNSPYRVLAKVESLVRCAVENADLPLVPGKPTDEGIAMVRDGFADARAAFVAARRAAGTDADILAAVRACRKSRVQAETVRRVLDELAAIEEPIPDARPKNWAYVSERELRELDDGAADYTPSPIFPAVDALLDAADAIRGLDVAKEAHPFAESARIQYPKRTLERGKLTFAGVKSALHGVLRDPSRGPVLAEALAETYRIAMVDECQDTDSAQFAIFESIFAANHRALVFIGDPKQAIYGFRGADVNAYLAARDRATARYTMEKNHRSRRALVSTLDTLYARAADPFGEIAIAYPPVVAAKEDTELPELEDATAMAAVEILYVDDKTELAERIAADVVRSLHEADVREPDGSRHALRPRDIAVLTRSNSEIDSVCRALRSRGVPAVASSNRSVLRSDEAGYVLRFVEAVLEPGNARKVRALLLTPLFDYTPRRLAALRTNDADWDALVERLLDLRAALRSGGISQAYARFAREEALEARLLLRADGFRVVTNLAHVLELALRVAAERRLGPEGVVSWLERARAGDADDEGASTEERGLRLEHSGDAVQVLTIHKSKGLEYGLVYVLGVTKAPARPPQCPIVLATGPGERSIVTRFDRETTRQSLAEQREEQARLAYVALTRAIFGLRVVFAPAAKEFSKKGFAGTAVGAVLAGSVPQKGDAYLDGDGLREHLVARYEALVRDAGVSIALRDLTDRSREPYVARTDSRPLFAPTPAMREFSAGPRTSSFSGLVADADHAPPDDRDRTAPDLAESDAPLPDDPLAGVEGGAKLGVVIHDILESLDFDASIDAIRDHVHARTHASNSFTDDVEPITTTVARVLATPLRAAGPRLCDVPRDRTFRELEFHLSVGLDGAFDARGLGALFTKYDVPARGSDYGASIASLGFDALRGYLHGFVDLVFEHEGRFYVVDYKSNRLGAPFAYAASALTAPMMASHYVLQYALYTVALHRMLRRRVAAYDYDTHMGGALYLFLRGMDPPHGASLGVFEHRLPAAFVHALDALLDGRSAP